MSIKKRRWKRWHCLEQAKGRCQKRQIAEAVHLRSNIYVKIHIEAACDKISWKYVLSLELEDVGFDASLLSDFRARLLATESVFNLFEYVLKHLSEKRASETIQ